MHPAAFLPVHLLPITLPTCSNITLAGNINVDGACLFCRGAVATGVVGTGAPAKAALQRTDEETAEEVALCTSSHFFATKFIFPQAGDNDHISDVTTPVVTCPGVPASVIFIRAPVTFRSACASVISAFSKRGTWRTPMRGNVGNGDWEQFCASK